MATLPDGTTQVIPTGTYPAATHVSPAVSLTPTQSKITVTADRNSWPDTGSNVVSLTVDISFNGGLTFSFLCGFTAVGGNSTNPFTGLPQTTSGFSMALPQVGNANRQLRVSITLFVSLNTAASVTVS